MTKLKCLCLRLLSNKYLVENILTHHKMSKFSISILILSLTWLASEVNYADALPHPIHKPRSTNLNSSYLDVRFGQPRSDIEAYSLSTMRWVASHHYHPGSYLQSGFFALAEWDQDHGTNVFEKDVDDANEKYSHHPGKCYGYYKVPFVNLWNDFPAWAAMGVLEAQAAYNRSKTYLAEGVFQVSTTWVRPIRRLEFANKRPSFTLVHFKPWIHRSS